MRIGYFLSSEEFGPRELIGRRAWLRRQASKGCGSPTTSILGTTSRATAVSCGRRSARSPKPPPDEAHDRRDLSDCAHPSSVIAQAAATSAVLLEGRFALGLGSGEALNEHILGDRWPAVDTRLEMLEEAVEVIRTLWQGGNAEPPRAPLPMENARIYDLPEQLPPILISGFGSKSTSLAATHRRRLLHCPPRRRSRRILPRPGRRGEAGRGGHEGMRGRDRARGTRDGAPAVAQ